MWCAAGGCYGVDPCWSYSYPQNVNSWAVYGPFSLADATDAELLFKTYCVTASGDYFAWLASTNGSQFYGYQTSGSSGGWVDMNFDLTSVPTLGNLCGKPQLWIAFLFRSDQYFEYLDGVYVDDVVLQKYVGIAPPTITSIDPLIGSAGTGTRVSIIGKNFGAVQGTSKVEFFYQSGQPKIAAPVVSWSDTKIVCEVPVGDVGGYQASASSGPVTVTTAAGTSNGFDFTVTFGYGQAKWTNSPPVMRYRINENTSDCTGEGAAVQAAGTTWTSAGSLFSFQYIGSHTNTNYGYNGYNDIMWGSTGGSIATTYIWYSAGQIQECDVVFNDPSYTWSTSCGINMDIQTAAAHELGHCLMLRDLYGAADSNKVMYGFGSAGTCKRVLNAGDNSGIFWIYNSGSIGQTKKPAGRSVVWAGKLVTGVFDGFFYIEEPDRSAGIRVDWAGAPVNVGDMVDVKGTTSQTALGEPKLVASYVAASAVRKAVPLGLNARAASDPLPEGLLVRCFGNVSYLDPGWAFFYLDDGSGVLDGSGSPGIRVMLTGIILPPDQGTNVTVTGIRTRDTVGAGPSPALMPRAQEDIRQ